MKDTPAPWIETEAVVTSCRFQFARLNTLRFGMQTGEKFRIGFEYDSLASRHADEFQSPVAIPQGERLRITYNPQRPQENSRSHGNIAPTGRGTLVSIGIGGSILLSLIWLSILRGCQ